MDYSLSKLFRLIFTWFLLIFFCSSTIAIPNLGRHSRNIRNIQTEEDSSNTESPTQNDIETQYYSQTLDHFNYQPESYLTFKQKYMIYSKYWGGGKSNSPILVFLGDEQAMLKSELDYLILPDYAAQLNALIVVIEHRFYGESVPFGLSTEDVVKNASIRGYFNSAQAVADYVELILHLKQNLKAHHSPVIVVGGSYGGMLASWLRLKYPHVALGALASSAPLLYFDNIISPNRGYYYVVNKDYKESSTLCYEIIKKSWSAIDRIGSKPNGLSYLSKKFNTCGQLNNTGDLKAFLQLLYGGVAQYADPVYNPSMICNAIDRGSNGTDTLSRIYAAVVAYYGVRSCYDINGWTADETTVKYDWQSCSELVMPLVRGTSSNSMFPPEAFNLSEYMQDCHAKYNVMPRPHWITTYYGGHDMKLILKRFGSNIIFSNGLMDPYSSAGVVENLSESVIALATANGSHCQDISSAREDDQEWLINQRQTEIRIIMAWIQEYYADLKNYLQ